MRADSRDFCSSHEGRLRDNFVISFKKHYVLVETFCSSIPYFIFMLNEFVIFQFVSQMVRVWSIKKKAQWVIQWVKGGTHTGVPEMSESRDVFALKTAYTHLWQFIIHCLVTGTSVWCRSCSHCVWTWSNKKKTAQFSSLNCNSNIHLNQAVFPAPSTITKYTVSHQNK